MARASCSGMAIAAVQLVAWCSAGAVLLYRGVATITAVQESNGTHDHDSPENYRRGNPPQVTAEDHRVTPAPVMAWNVSGAQLTAWNGKITFDIRPAALAMAIIGSVMLVIGPLLVGLRICDSRRQRRTFLKLRQDEASADHGEDPPPTYEEVTAGAPRYSALFHTEGDTQC